MLNRCASVGEYVLIYGFRVALCCHSPSQAMIDHALSRGCIRVVEWVGGGGGSFSLSMRPRHGAFLLFVRGVPRGALFATFDEAR